MKNVIKPLAKSVLIPLAVTAAASTADTGIHKKVLGSVTHFLSPALMEQIVVYLLMVLKSLNSKQ